jgi:flavodoxin
MKALVTYYSQSGNTEKLAQAIYDAIDVEKEIKPIQDVENTAGYDIIFFGFPVQAHSVPVKAQGIFKLLTPGQKVAIFSTHGSLRGGQLAVTAMEHATSLASGAKVLGKFGCRGKVPLSLIEALMKQPEHKAWAQEAQSAASHPDEADLADGKDFVKQMMAKAS